MLNQINKTIIEITPVIIKLNINDIKPVEVFENLINSDNSIKAFLFENNEENKPAYSFLGINPLETLRVKDNLVTLEKNNETSILSGDPVEIINDYLLKYNFTKKEDCPEFTGGIIGNISYDFVKYLEKINLPQTNSFSENETCLMLFKDIIVFDHINNQLFIISNILKENPSETDYQKALEINKTMEKRVVSSPKIKDLEIIEPKDLLKTETSFGQENFYQAVKKVKSYIKNGDIFQCVLSESFSFDLDVAPYSVYKILRKINPSPYLFYISTGTEVLLGSSPEMLAKVSAGKVNLCPIAGTRPRGIDQLEDKKFEKSLLRSVKEKAEHLMLVDLGRNDVGKVSKPGSVKVKQFMQVEKFSAVMHLVSLVEGELETEKNSFDAFKSTFPAGTLSGAPKVRAMQIISELEPVRRGAYGGAVFCYGFSGYLDSCITIRSLFIKDKKAYIQAGAGIVADSTARKEYEEIQNKAKAVLKAVTIAQNIYSNTTQIK